MVEQQSPHKVWFNLFLDIIIPVFVLNNLSARLGENGALYALLIAISFPLGHGLYDFVTSHKLNWLSLLGFTNVLLTGGFALFKLEGFWFAVKEASFPTLIGLFVMGSAYTQTPLFKFFLRQPGLFDLNRIDQELHLRDNLAEYYRLLRRSTLLFSITFFLSGLLNFLLALHVFEPIATHLSEQQRAEILNSQIAKMTWQGYFVIALPLMLITAAIFYYSLRRLSQLTQLGINELMVKPIE